MFFAPNSGVMAAGVQEALPGQALFINYADFVVPDGVTSISVVAIGSGGGAGFVEDNSTSYSGGGGALSYSNDIPVTPGETLKVRFGGMSQLARITGSKPEEVLVSAVDANYEMSAPSSSGVGQVRFAGGAGRTGTLTQNRPGAGAAGYTGNGASATSSTGSMGGGGTSPYGGGGGAPVGASSNANGQLYGGGAAYRSNNNPGQRGWGCVRIIWGNGRAFPNTNTGDV